MDMHVYSFQAKKYLYHYNYFSIYESVSFCIYVCLLPTRLLPFPNWPQFCKFDVPTGTLQLPNKRVAMLSS